MMHTWSSSLSTSAPCTPPGNGVGLDNSSSLNFDSACTFTVGKGHAAAEVTPRPSTSTCSHSFADDPSYSDEDAEHSARTSLLASSCSPFVSLPHTLSPKAIQAPIPISAPACSSSNEQFQAQDPPPKEAIDDSTTPPNSPSTAISPALAQLPPVVLHELIASATSNLYIRGLPIHITDSHLFSLCSPHGHVLSAKSIVDLRTGQCKGYGFVLFARPHDAVAAMLFINKNPYVLGGPRLQASMARESFAAKLKVLQDDESANVYLSNLPLAMDDQGLIDLLKPVHALSVRILVGPTGVSRGVGFARLANRDAASQIISKLNRLTLDPGLPPLQVRFADSPAQKMLKAVTCPPPPRKGPPGPARPCAGEMSSPSFRSKSHPAQPQHPRGRTGPAPPRVAGRVKRIGSETVLANRSPSAVTRSVVQTVMGNGRKGGAASVPRVNLGQGHMHGHGRHSSMGSWETAAAAGNQQERGRTMYRRMQVPAQSSFQSGSSQQTGTSSMATSTHTSTPVSPSQQPGMYFIPYPTPTTPSMHDPSTGFPLHIPMPLFPPHAPDASPPMYFVAMDPSSPHVSGQALTSTPCHIAYAAVDQYGQPIMTWAMPCTAVTAPPVPVSLPAQAPQPNAAPIATSLSPIASPSPMSPPALDPWSSSAGGSANPLSSPPLAPPALTSSSSMDELALPSMSEPVSMASVREEGAEYTWDQGDTKPRAKSFSVSMLMNSSAAGQTGSGV